MSFGLWASVGPRNRVLHGVQISPWEGAILGERVPHCKVYAVSAVRCAETAEPIDLLFGLWSVDSNGPKESCVRWGSSRAEGRCHGNQLLRFKGIP